MTSQLPLPFDARRLARSENPTTSKSAAAACRELRSEHHSTILAVMNSEIVGQDELMVITRDWNADEIAEKCSLDRHQIGRRLHELERSGMVRKSGRQRATPTGRLACCYEAKPWPAECATNTSTRPATQQGEVSR